MIIDADCHICSQKFDQSAIVDDELIELMDQAGVDKALTWLRPPYNKNIDPENAAVHQAVQKYPNRLIGFGWTNPNLGKEPAERAIKQSFEEYGFAGIKFNGAQDNYVIDDAGVMPFIEKACSFKKPIAFHIGADFYENTHPYRLGRIAKRFPETSFLMVHMGGAGTPSLARAAIETALDCPNITIIASAIPDVHIRKAIIALGGQRICFGSDSPFGIMNAQLAMHRAILEEFDETTRKAVLGETISALIM